MSLINQLFPDVIKEAQDVQAELQRNEAEQNAIGIKRHLVLKATISGNLSEDNLKYFQKEEVRLSSEVKKLEEANSKLQEKFRTLSNRVRVLQEVAKDYEKNRN